MNFLVKGFDLINIDDFLSWTMVVVMHRGGIFFLIDRQTESTEIINHDAWRVVKYISQMH